MSRPVLVLGVEPRISVPIARSLHSHGLDVDVAGLSSSEPAIASRSIRRCLDLSNSSPDNVHRSLVEKITQQGYDVLIPATDAALAFVAERENLLRSLLTLTCPAREVVERVLNKALTLEIASRIGIGVPRTKCVTDRKQIEDSVQTLRFPVIAKPYDKRAETDFKVKILVDRECLLNAFPKGIGGGVLLQEFASGDGVGVEVLMHRGDPIAAFQHRRLKEVPSTGGAAVVAISEQPDPFLLDQAIALLRAIGWQGIAMVEFRYDCGQKRSALMEVNGRYWGTLALAIRSGVDFPWYEWQLAHGQQPAVQATYAVGARWRWTAGYLRRWHGLAPRALMRGLRPKALKALLPSLRDLSPFSRDALWQLNDPLPAINEASCEMRKLIGSGFKSAVGELRRRKSAPPLVPMPTTDEGEREVSA